VVAVVIMARTASGALEGGMAERGGRLAIRAGRLLDVEAGAVRAGAVLLVEGDRIAAVLRAGEPVPADVQELDLSGHTVLPGLIDCHTHLVGDSLPVGRSAAQEAFSGVRNARATVMAGFTTVRDVGTFRAFVDVASATRSPTARWWGRGWRSPAPTSPFRAAAARSPAWPPASSCRPTSASAWRRPRPRSGRGRGRSSTAVPTSSR
jgi:hypothetical protein